MLLAVTVVVVVAAASAGVTWFLVDNDDGPKPAATPTAQASVTAAPLLPTLSLSYPQGWKAQTMSTVDRRAGLVAKAERGAPTASFLVRAVTTTRGERVAAAALAEQTARALAAGVTGYVGVERRVVRVAGSEVVRIVYRQTVKGEPPSQTLLVLLALDGRAFYITARSAAADAGRLVRDTEALVAAAVAAALK